jgi:hypothetical protein
MRVLAVSSGMTTSAITWQGVFTPTVVTGIAYVAAPIPGLVSAEVVERLCTMFRQWSMVPVMRIVAVVDMTVKTRMSVKPRSGSDKDPTKEPIGAIVPVGCAVIGSVIEVPIRAHGRDPDADTYLSRRPGGRTEQRHG